MGRLSAAFVRKVKEPGAFGDGRGGHGLVLRVKRTASGDLAKSWVQRIRVGGKPTNIGHGSWPVVTLKEARELALEVVRAIRRGDDPRHQASRVPTFADAAGKVIELRSASWRNPLTADIWRAGFETYVYPTIGDKPVDEVTGADVLAVLTPIWTTRRETARRMKTRVGAVMRWAIAQQYRHDDPTVAIAQALPKNGGPTKHHRSIPHHQVGAAIAAVQESGAWLATKLMVTFAVLCACRPGESRGAVWSEVDMERRVWSIPGDRMKTGKPHRVPLSESAYRVLREAEALRDKTDLLFPSPTGKELSNMSAGKLLSEQGINGTLHGFRASFRSWCAESDESRELAELALGHAVPGIEGAYQRSDLFERRRSLMTRWASYVFSDTK